MRARDERFATRGRHQQGPDPLHDKSRPIATLPVYQPRDLTCDPVARSCVCPAGKSLYRKGKDLVVNGYRGAQFRGVKRDRVPCTHRARWLRTPMKSATRQVLFFNGPARIDRRAIRGRCNAAWTR